jgi:hypothetical protein
MHYRMRVYHVSFALHAVVLVHSTGGLLKGCRSMAEKERVGTLKRIARVLHPYSEYTYHMTILGSVRQSCMAREVGHGGGIGSTRLPRQVGQDGQSVSPLVSALLEEYENIDREAWAVEHVWSEDDGNPFGLMVVWMRSNQVLQAGSRQVFQALPRRAVFGGPAGFRQVAGLDFWAASAGGCGSTRRPLGA